MLDIDPGRQRVQRLRAVMDRLGVDVAVLTHPKNVYYFSGHLAPWTTYSVLVLTPARSILASGARPETCFADELRTYEGCPLATVRPDQAALAFSLIDDLVRPAKRLGTEFSSCTAFIMQSSRGIIDIEPDILRLRRRKDEDELELIRQATRATRDCYVRARELIQPGLNELDLYAELYHTAIRACGERIGSLGNDFQCGTPGGPPRARPAQAGEIWILDLGVEYRGYFSDMCRTFAVQPPITDEQYRAWERIVAVIHWVEDQVSPGVRCRVIFEEVKRQLDGFIQGSFSHHLGHGFGLTPHEAPHLNPHWDETFEVGDTFTVEPGLYDASLRGGIRLENEYVVTADGVECLTPFPLELDTEKSW